MNWFRLFGPGLSRVSACFCLFGTFFSLMDRQILHSE
jgi:hypothetical protein